MAKGKKRSGGGKGGSRGLPGMGGAGGAGAGGGGMGNLLSQMQKLQEEMEKTQAELETEEVSVTVGGGMVTVVATGDQKVKSITIQPDVVDPEDVEMLQDLILTGVNDALTKARELQEERMGGLTNGMDLPPGLGM